MGVHEFTVANYFDYSCIFVVHIESRPIYDEKPEADGRKVLHAFIQRRTNAI